MQKINTILKKLHDIDNKIIESEITFSDRTLILNDIINIYKVRENIANLKQNKISSNAFHKFTMELSTWQDEAVSIKMVSIIKENSFRLFIFDENYDSILRNLELELDSDSGNPAL